MRVNDRFVSMYFETDHEYRPISFDVAKTALLIIDMQKGFVSRPQFAEPTAEQQAEAARWEPFFRHMDDVVIPNNQKIIEAFRRRGAEIIFARVQSRKQNGRDRSRVHITGYPCLIPPGDADAEIIAPLAPAADEIVLEKTTDSALTGTNLRLMLHNLGVEDVVVTGVFTDQCVSCTVRSLADESFQVWLVEDAAYACSDRIHQTELEILNHIYCQVIDTAELLAALPPAE